jgi:hypothetical protein
MLLNYGSVEKLTGLPWQTIEVRTLREYTFRRIAAALPGLFRAEPVQIFIPVRRRDLGIFECDTANYVFVRSTGNKVVGRLKTITGVVGLLTTDGSNRLSKVIKIDDGYVQGLIQDTEAYFRRDQGIEVGSFVRILSSRVRDYCGTVEEKDGEAVVVRVSLKSKSLMVETTIYNLLNLSHVPAEQRVWYYSALVDQLGQDGQADLVAPDLQMDPEQIFVPRQPKEAAFNRQTVSTLMVKKLIDLGVVDPLIIAKKVLRAMREQKIKPVKNLYILYVIIKDNLLKRHYVKEKPFTDWREVCRAHPEAKFGVEDLEKIDPELGIPLTTAEKCMDGRSREARDKRRAGGTPTYSVVKCPTCSVEFLGYRGRKYCSKKCAAGAKRPRVILHPALPPGGTTV